MIKTIKWVSNPRRKVKTMGAQQPVMPSEYFKILCEIGAGWKR